MAGKISSGALFHILQLSQEIDAYLDRRNEEYSPGKVQKLSTSDIDEMDREEREEAVQVSFGYIAEQLDYGPFDSRELEFNYGDEDLSEPGGRQQSVQDELEKKSPLPATDGAGTEPVVEEPGDSTATTDIGKPGYFNFSTPPEFITGYDKREELYHTVLNRLGPEQFAEQFDEIVANIADELGDPELEDFAKVMRHWC